MTLVGTRVGKFRGAVAALLLLVALIGAAVVVLSGRELVRLLGAPVLVTVAASLSTSVALVTPRVVVRSPFLGWPVVRRSTPARIWRESKFRVVGIGSAACLRVLPSNEPTSEAQAARILSSLG